MRRPGVGGQNGEGVVGAQAGWVGGRAVVGLDYGTGTIERRTGYPVTNDPCGV